MKVQIKEFETENEGVYPKIKRPDPKKTNCTDNNKKQMYG